MILTMASPAAADLFALVRTEPIPGGFSPVTLTAFGNGCAITVACGSEAEIPSDAVLSVSEIENWEDKSAIPSGYELAFSRAFDISILNGEGEKIQPKSGVRVSIELPEANDADKVRVLHYAAEEELPADEKGQSAVADDETLLADETVEEGVLSGRKRGLEAEGLQLGKKSLRGASSGLLGLKGTERDGGFYDSEPNAEEPEQGEESFGAEPVVDEKLSDGEKEAVVGELLEAAVEDGVVCFETDGFSIFAVIGLRTLEKRIVASDGHSYDITVTYGPEAGIGDHNLFPADRGGVAFVQGFHVQQEQALDLRQPLGKAGADRVGSLHRILTLEVLEPHGRNQLVPQPVQGTDQQRFLRHVRIIPAEGHGEQQGLQLVKHLHDFQPVRRRTGMISTAGLFHFHLCQSFDR